MESEAELVGRRVELLGLGREELNGQRGRATHFDAERHRYGVLLDGASEPVAIRASNLTVAPPEPLTEADKLELLECARYGEDDDLKHLLSLGVPVDFQDADGNTALHRACANGHTNAIKILARAGASHKANSSGNTPAHWAVQYAPIEAVKALLNKVAHSSKSQTHVSLRLSSAPLPRPARLAQALAHEPGKDKLTAEDFVGGLVLVFPECLEDDVRVYAGALSDEAPDTPAGAVRPAPLDLPRRSGNGPY